MSIPLSTNLITINYTLILVVYDYFYHFLLLPILTLCLQDIGICRFSSQQSWKLHSRRITVFSIFTFYHLPYPTLRRQYIGHCYFLYDAPTCRWAGVHLNVTGNVTLRLCDPGDYGFHTNIDRFLFLHFIPFYTIPGVLGTYWNISGVL
jgi:hypothetical protein